MLSLRHWADAYNGVWGTTEALKAQFYQAVCECMDQNRRVKIIQAQVDKITSLKEYKDRAFSHFLFYVVRRPSRCRARPRSLLTFAATPRPPSQNGELKDTVIGPKLPAIRKNIQLLAVPPLEKPA